MPTGAEGAGIVVIVHDHRMELDLSRLRNPPEQQSVLAHRPEDGSGGRYHACSGDLRARTRGVTPSAPQGSAHRSSMRWSRCWC